MATSHIRSLRVIREASFGSLNASGVPDHTIFDGSEAVIEIDRGTINIYGAHPQNERDDIRSGFHGIPADPETVVDNSGSPIQRLTGQIQLDVTFKSIGTEDPDDVPLLWLLASGLTPLGADPTNAEVTVETGGVAGSFVVADAVAEADLPTGGMIAYMPTGAQAAAFAQVVEKASAGGDTTVEYSPLLPETLATDAVIRSCATFGSLPGRPLGSSLAFRVNIDGGEQAVFGARMSAFTLNSDGRRLRGQITLDFAIAQTAHGSATQARIARAPFRPAGGHVLHTLRAEVSLSDIIETAANAPRVGGRNVICVDEWSVTVTNTLTPVLCWGSILGMTEMEVTERSSEVSLTLSTPNTTIAADYLNRRHRTLAMSFGPAPGMGLIIPAAYLTADPNLRDLGGDLVRQVLTYREGLPLLVAPTAAEAISGDHLANSPILLGFGLTAAE